MFKEVRVYLHNEDEAEQLRAKLSKYATNQVVIDYLEDSDGVHLVVPYLPLDVGGANTANSGIGAPYAVGYQEIENIDDENPRTTVLAFEISEDDLNDALVEIQQFGGHVDRAIFE
ncbi:hypothetical protein ACS127_07280 [Amphibacillus sp. Q70]|uniref:hypothetical protein n=1 Tax=Amphibacillus sp. Q70 TaxID=3453416 RepID=UPI003F84849B